MFDSIHQGVVVHIDILSRVELKSQPDIENTRIKTDIQQWLTADNSNVSISSIVIKSPMEQATPLGKDVAATPVLVTVDIVVLSDYVLDVAKIQELKRYLADQYKKDFSIQVNIIRKTTVHY